MAYWYVRTIAWLFELTSPFAHTPPNKARAGLKQSLKLAPWLVGRPQSCTATEDREIAGVPVRVYRPSAGTLPVIAYFHGGGWVEGDLDTHDVPCRALANLSGALVVAVHYRRAPEQPFPAAIDDCEAVVRWLAAHADQLDGDGLRLAVAGESAGGHLAAVVAQKCRDLPLRAQLLIYPVVDCSKETQSYAKFATGNILSAERMRYFIQAFVPDAKQRADPRASPLLASDVSGVAPAYLSSAPEDVLRDEGLAYAEKLRSADVVVTVVDAHGLLHGYVNMLGLSAAMDEFTRAAQWLRDRLA
ncbi:MAG: alpha/beta hydrolase [Myxococcales bacterium]|nr:alpha/beta hydrolase [Myxococcales bacterium]